MIGPASVPIHAREIDRLIGVRPTVEMGIEILGFGPESKRKPANIQEVPAHSFAAFLCIRGEGDQFRN